MHLIIELQNYLSETDKTTMRNRKIHNYTQRFQQLIDIIEHSTPKQHNTHSFPVYKNIIKIDYKTNINNLEELMLLKVCLMTEWN